ncbi:MAG: S1-like domain-containing RNA-binding protein, partial [Bacteroidota bacterium]
MIAIGDFAELEVVKKVDFGIYLDGGPLGEILLPLKEVPEGTEPGQDLNVFLYCDSEDRVIATTQKPYAKAGDLVGLKVVDTTDFGAFLDWGLLKDLFVPFCIGLCCSAKGTKR